MPTNPPPFEAIQTAVQAYCRDYVRAQRDRGRSYAEIAKQLGVTHVWIIQLDKGEGGGGRSAGGKIEYHVAWALHGGSIDGLREAALNVQAGGRVILEEPGSGQAVRLPAEKPEPSPRKAGPRSSKQRR